MSDEPDPAARIERQILRKTKQIEGEAARIERNVLQFDEQFRRELDELGRGMKRKLGSRFDGSRRRKPPESGILQPAVPPRGPLPLVGGAEAPIPND